MGRATYKGLVPPYDPMFSTGPELFSRPESSASLRNTPTSADKKAPAASTSKTFLLEGSQLQGSQQNRKKPDI